MSFRGYKLQHKLIVLHNSKDLSDPDLVYANTYEITLFISRIGTEPMPIDEDGIHNVIVKTLEPYTEKNIEQIEPFNQLQPTFENIGIVFYNQLKQSIAQIGLTLETLEISDSPIRTFIVNKTNTKDWFFVGDKKIKTSGLLLGNLISQTTSYLASSFESEEAEAISASRSVPETKHNKDGEPAEERAKPVHITLAPSLVYDHASPFRFALSVLCLVIIGSLLSLYLKNTGAYPSGADIYGHLFKSDLLYNSIKNGDMYPLYTDLWYNGVQPFRYWAPLPYYLLAFLQFFAGGDAEEAYLLFTGFAVVAGGIGWLLWGAAYHRMTLCTFIACLWFFLPDNMRVFFVEGNLPRMVIAILLPYLFYFIWRFVEYRIKWAIIPAAFVMCLITFCHAMIAAMTGITIFLFLLIYSISYKRIRQSIYLIAAMLLSFAICGIWMYPALSGGLIGMEAAATAEVMKALSTPVMVSLNLILRNVGLHEMFYFGLSILMLSIVGVFLSNKKSRVGFFTVIIIFCGTTTAFVPFLEKLPLNQLFWMTRFTPIVYAIFILSLLEWRKCRRYAMILIAIVIIIDCIPSLDLQKYHSQTPSILTYTLNDAKEITKQRVSLLDVSAYGSYPSFGFTAEEPKTRYTFGWAWQGASTAQNIVMINTALEKGYYYYLFDRSIELGDDTVLVRKELVEQAKKTVNSLIKAAAASGYSYQKETNYAYIFHKSTPQTFGVSTKYIGLTIGRNARSIALEFPGFEEGGRQYVTDYTPEELSRYKVIYLSGFQYSDRQEAEDLLRQAADAGTRIIIDMNQIPVDPITSRMKFFDVTSQTITFLGHYPELVYENSIYETKQFKEEFSNWNTVYLDNLKDVIGYSWFQNKKIAFLGRNNHDNIYFMGYNMLYHAMETNDRAIKSILSDLLMIKPNQLPERKLVPLKIVNQENKIVINSPGGRVNTTLAYQDNFRSDQIIINQNNLLTVVKPNTEITIVYPFMIEGLTVSIIGLLGMIILVYFVNRERSREK
ncbi:MAG: 6-pyruvoyl-tetrahydropterin synthase-related protein [Eubacteriales bacterium]|nr:6-pyruvoyl-tetrahydropterin synthase-related protein [Eubacteriales bacterium]